MQESRPALSAWMPFAFTLAVVAVVAPMRRGAQAIVDRLFFRATTTSRTLEEVSGRLTGSLDASEIARRIEETLGATVGSDLACSCFPTAPVDSAKRRDASRSRSSRAPVRRSCLGGPGSRLEVGGRHPLSGDPDPGTLEAAGITLLVPLRADGVVEGVWRSAKALGRAVRRSRSRPSPHAREPGGDRAPECGSYTALRELSESLEQRVCERTAALARTHEELLATQTHLARADKLASLGRLVAGVAHEINNPVAFVSSSVDLIRDAAVRVRDRLGDGADPALTATLDRLVQNTDICQDGAQRAAQIVRDLTAFARTSQQEQPIDLNAALDRTLQLLRAARPATASGSSASTGPCRTRWGSPVRSTRC
jgi:hypothetical protein